MWVMWWTKRHWGKFSPSTSVSPANHSTNFSIIIITRGWQNRPISGRSAEWTQLDSTLDYTILICLNRLMLFKGIIAVYCENHMKHTNTLCLSRMQSFCYVNVGGTYSNQRTFEGSTQIKVKCVIQRCKSGPGLESSSANRPNKVK
jgi:hypothetical protein